MNLKTLFYQFMNEYADELNEARAHEDFKRPFGNLVRHDIAQIIQEKVNNTIYKVKGSVGAGRWTDVPWIAVFDTRITSSAQKGVYIVYLLNKNTKELYLTLNQGATDVAQEGGNSSEGKLAFTGIATASNDKTTGSLKAKADGIRNAISGRSKLESGVINTGSKAYDAGCIYFKKYSLLSLPEDDELFADLYRFVEAYRLYYDLVFCAQKQEDKVIEAVCNNGEMNPMAIKDQIDNIKRYIEGNGFTYSGDLIENFYLSLKSKPFVILAGTSGTGKTRLVKLFAEAIGATAENGRYKLVSVRPDWSDSSDLFGHANLQGEFVPGAIIDFIKKASENKEKPYFLCLDEMNLARVEYYLSDFLSIIETRKRNNENGEIITDEIVLDKVAQENYGGLYLPENLYVIGTVNMDETTFPFSKKVLDRANTIEFSYVDLNPDFSSDVEATEGIELGNEFLKTKYIILKTDTDASDYAYITEVCTELQVINRILQEANAHVGYRVRDEIVFYMLNSEKAKLLSYEDALDNEIMQKILPRIQGSGAAIKELLCELFKKFAGDYSGLSQESTWKQMKTYIGANEKNCKYKKSAEKICYMMRRFEEDGFTSYWL